jgi:predicted 3-demethylubiquinone-9 3-methyltransferase (glyoxalase superfamily)
MTATSKLRTFLWFPDKLDDALAFYRETFGAVVHSENRLGSDGPLFTADFSIYGHEFIGLNWAGGPAFNEAISLSLSVEGQDEVDRLWNAITAEGKEGQCGWCTDKWGVSWQVTPIQMSEHLGNPDPELAAYANQALRQMGKIVLAEFVKPAE